jgi:UDP:flavonoid glycosyltransferase YjiC (YdhE family)
MSDREFVMRIFILTIGSRGDFELFLMLARALRDRGHPVTLGTPGFYADQVRQAGLHWVQIGNSTRAEMVAALQSVAPEADLVQRVRLYAQRWLEPQLRTSFMQIHALATGSDYFISNLKMSMQRQGQVMPGALVTYDPPFALDSLRQYGSQQSNGLLLELVAMNRALVDPQGLWGKEFRFTGFWKDEHATGWSPPADLQTFLAAGPPPVVVTMGSMVMFGARRLVQTVTTALQQAGQRGVIVSGWSGIASTDSTAGAVYCAEEVPYDWLFPQASCVIHHGGCGTVAAVLRAGVPSIVLPQITCQEIFGRALERAHLATGIFDAHTLEPTALAGAIQQALSDETVRQSARRWQQTVAEDRGVKAAADWITDHARACGAGAES